MPGTLALDVGTRRTGVALLDPRVGFPMPLDTIQHKDIDALREQVFAIIAQREITDIIVGLPLLPSGAVGSQAQMATDFAASLREKGLNVTMRDERYTTSKRASFDGDAAAAMTLLAGPKEGC